MKKRLLIVSGTGLFIFIAATALYHYRPQALYSSTRQAVGQQSVDAWHAQDVPHWTLVRGQELVYDLNYAGSGYLPGQIDKAFEISLQGTLHILILSEDTESYRVWLGIRSAGAPQLNHIPAPASLSLQKAWIEGISGRLATRGFYLEALTNSQMDPAVSQFWQSLCERIRVEIPMVLQAPIWDQDETVAGGIVTARYEIDSTHPNPALLGEKIYVHKFFDAALRPQYQLSGESLILLKPRFEGLDQLQAEAREVQELNGQSWGSDTALKLQWQRLNQVSEERVASLEARWGLSEGQALQDATQERSIKKNALESPGLDEIWGLMIQPGWQNSQELYLKLKAWIFLHPNEIPRLMDRVKGLDESDPVIKMTIRALAGAGHSEAQSALVELLNQRHTAVPLARKIITTLGLLPHPTLKAQQSLEILSGAAEDSALRRNSRLALGMMGQRLGQEQDVESQKRAADIETAALENLHQATGPTAITEALAVLGNHGPRSIQELDLWLKDPDPAIRGQAFFALRFAKPILTPDFLVSSYSSEASAQVRRQIMQALTLRKLDDSWFQAVSKLILLPLPDEEKITLAKSLMGTTRKYKRESLKIIGHLVEKTKDAAIRESLAKYQETVKKQVTL